MKRKNETLRKDLQAMQRKVWQLQKKQARSAKHDQRRPSLEMRVLTPTKNADVLLRDIGITPRKATRVRKTLILHHTLMKDLRTSGKMACRFAIKSVSKTFSARLVAGTLKMQRKVPKSAYEKAESKRKVTAAINRKSVGFFKKDENATCLPGKWDSVKVDGKRIQKYILNDSIRILYIKSTTLKTPSKTSA